MSPVRQVGAHRSIVLDGVALGQSAARVDGTDNCADGTPRPRRDTLRGVPSRAECVLGDGWGLCRVEALANLGRKVQVERAEGFV